MPENTIIGILVDVSGSMKENLQINVRYNDENISRIQTVIKTIFDILKKENDSSAANKVFSLAFGLQSIESGGESCESGVCDFLCLIRFAVYLKSKIDIPNGKSNLNNLLKSRGVDCAEEFVNKHLTPEECAFVFALTRFEGNEHRIAQIIESLPSVCWSGAMNIINSGVNTFSNLIPIVGAKKSSYDAYETKKVADNAKNDFMITELKKIDYPTVFDITKAIEILESALDGKNTNGNLDKEKLDTIIGYLEPYIYGSTPMFKALQSAAPLFTRRYEEKILLLITDGKSRDGNPASFAKEFKDSNVIVIVCLLTSKNFENPRQLHYVKENDWSEWEKNMFDLSTAVDNTHPMMSLLLERGWNLAPEGHSKLFFQANHPNIISEIGEIISAENNDLVLNVLARASLEEYINFEILKKDRTVEAPEQKGKTCYANASAYVIWLALQRIHGSEAKDVTFEKLREDMIKEYGYDGGPTKDVLDKYCQKYRLHCAEVDEKAAKIAVSKRRAIAAIFQLYDNQWDDFSEFYHRNKNGILKKSHLSTNGSGEIGGHAVMLVKVTPEYLLFMNSWGTSWADEGFFRVENASVLNMELFDVYWFISDLTAGEKVAYEELKKSGTKLIDKIPTSLTSLPYTCPKCKKASPANTFKGHLEEKLCPKCNKKFIPLMLYFFS